MKTIQIARAQQIADSEKRDVLEWRARIWKYLDGDKIFSVKAF